MSDGERSNGRSLFPRTLETERLELERLCHDTVDARAYYEHCSEHNPHIEEVTRYLPWDPHETPRETVEYVDELERKWTEGTRGEWVIRPKSGEESETRNASEQSSSEGLDEPLGPCERGDDPRPDGSEPRDGAGEIAGSACLVVDWETRTATPGIWLRKRFWGRGYSAERARALVALAFGRLDLDLVAVPVEDGNETSRRAVAQYVEALGGQYDGVVRNSTVRPDGRIVDHHRYTITRDQYDPDGT